MWALTDGTGILTQPTDIEAPGGYALVDSWFYDDYFNVPDGASVQSLAIDFVSLLQIDPDTIEAFMAPLQAIFAQVGQDILAWALYSSPATDVSIPTDFSALGYDVQLPFGGQTIAALEGYHLAVLYQPTASGSYRPDIWNDLTVSFALTMVATIGLVLVMGWAFIPALMVAGTGIGTGAIAVALLKLYTGQTTFHLPTVGLAPNAPANPINSGPLRPSATPYSPCASSDVGTSGCSGSGTIGTATDAQAQTNMMIGLAAVATGAIVAIAATSNRKG